MQLFFSFGQVFVFCELGFQISNRFEDVYDEICRFDWYFLPTELQHTWQIVIMVAQEPVELVSFGNIVCNRDTFKRVIVEYSIIFNILQMNQCAFCLLYFRLLIRAGRTL